MEDRLIGPAVYNYFHSMKDHSSNDIALYEFPLYSDSHITGETSIGDNGIFSLHNTLGMTGGKKVNPSLLLRIKFPSEPQIATPTDFSKSNYSRYHDGEISDEIAALLSLFLGIRLSSGSITRIFDNKNDKYGKALPDRKNMSYFDEINDHHLFHLNKSINIENFDISAFFAANPDDANALVMAARTYQKALWVSTYDRNMSWLFLVSAIEIIAKQYYPEPDPIENLKRVKPDWYNTLSPNTEILTSMSSELSPLIKSASFFNKFLLEFLPNPPQKRPPEIFCIKWNKNKFRKSFNKIYDHRSKALHQGIPFPRPMCEAPFFHEIYEEKPIGAGTSINGNIWLEEDMPLNLHIFEYIVREAIVKWFEQSKKNY